MKAQKRWMVTLQLILVAGIMLSFQNCGSASSGSNISSTGGSILAANAVYPTNSTSPFSITQTLATGGTSQPIFLFPSFGRFYVNSTPSINAAPAGEPWYELQINYHQCYPHGGTLCGFTPYESGRLYIMITCPGHINDPAACESALENVDLANIPSDLGVQISSQSTPFSNGVVIGSHLVSGTLRLHRSGSTPRPTNYSANNSLLDYGSKFEMVLTNVTLDNPIGGQPSLISIPTFQGEFWGDTLMNALWN